MAWPSTPGIRLTKRQCRELAKLAGQTSAPHALVQRARMILRLARVAGDRRPRVGSERPVRAQVAGALAPHARHSRA